MGSWGQKMICNDLHHVLGQEMFVVAVEQNVPLAINMQVWATQ